MGELIDKTKGRVKEVVGKVTDNRDLEAEGKMDRIKGEVKETFEDVKHEGKDLIDPNRRREP
jgi:uncharacterized protein YjbJ (UPF0337 family)